MTLRSTFTELLSEFCTGSPPKFPERPVLATRNDRTGQTNLFSGPHRPRAFPHQSPLPRFRLHSFPPTPQRSQAQNILRCKKTPRRPAKKRASEDWLFLGSASPKFRRDPRRAAAAQRLPVGHALLHGWFAPCTCRWSPRRDAPTGNPGISVLFAASSPPPHAFPVPLAQSFVYNRAMRSQHQLAGLIPLP